MPSADLARDGREWHVSVSVCTYNRHWLLRQALESLLAQRLDDGIRYEVIVVDKWKSVVEAELKYRVHRVISAPEVWVEHLIASSESCGLFNGYTPRT